MAANVYEVLNLLGNHLSIHVVGIIRWMYFGIILNYQYG